MPSLLRRLATALGVGTTALLAVSAAPANAATPRVIDSGVIVIAPDGSVSGELPPGTSKQHPPTDPNDPSFAARIRNGADAGLRRADGRPERRTSRSAASVAADDPPPCSRVVVNVVPTLGIGYRGEMLDCEQGDLTLHTWVEDETGAMTQDGAYMSCPQTTACATEERFVAPSMYVKVLARGQNLTTGYDHTDWQAMGT